MGRQLGHGWRLRRPVAEDIAPTDAEAVTGAATGLYGDAVGADPGAIRDAGGYGFQSG